MGEPGPAEMAFFGLRRALGLGVGLDEGGHLTQQKGPAFIDFDASSPSAASWPIEVGVSWLECGEVIMCSKLIRPRPEWPEDDWSAESEGIHNISRPNLDNAESADDVAAWLLKTVEGRVLVSDAPSFDQHWLDRLLNQKGPAIQDFDQLAWAAFSDDGLIQAGRLHRVYAALARQQTPHDRAGEDAANLCHAWRAGGG